VLRDPELAALLDQAGRNLETLELLALGDEAQRTMLESFKKRLEALRAAYARETHALTRKVLKRAIDRRVTPERRRGRTEARSL
jgi:hypothetical protein